MASPTDNLRISSLDQALFYAQLGLFVFPLHSIGDDGRCTCGNANCQNPGKHPKTKRGLLDATPKKLPVFQAANVAPTLAKGSPYIRATKAKPLFKMLYSPSKTQRNKPFPIKKTAITK